MIEMYTTGEAIVTESQLNDVEKYFGVKFPQAYIDFMLVTNGAIPLHGCFDSKDGKESSTWISTPSYQVIALTWSKKTRREQKDFLAALCQ